MELNIFSTKYIINCMQTKSVLTGPMFISLILHAGMTGILCCDTILVNCIFILVPSIFHGQSCI